MESKYNVFLLGENRNGLFRVVEDTLRSRLEDLGVIASDLVRFGRAADVYEYQPASPAVGIYFGNEGGHSDNAAVNFLVNESVCVIPVVEDLEAFQRSVPESLFSVNGMQARKEDEGLEAVVSVALEVFGLLRRSRRLFISYRRAESSAAAIQLYEYLDRCGFDVFLDTVSIRPGDQFQDVLWHRLCDTDIVVLLDTPEFLSSRWTRDELARASAMGIGLVQLVWPENESEVQRESALCYRVYLDPIDDFVGYVSGTSDNRLTEPALSRTATVIESFRARAIASRHSSLTQEIVEAAKLKQSRASIQPERYVLLERSGKPGAVVIPVVGVPDAHRCYEVDQIVGRLRDSNSPAICMAYDHQNILSSWCEHIDWLNNHLPIRMIRIGDFDKWIDSV